MSTYPEVVPGVTQHVLFRRRSGEDTWILGDVDQDRYITVPGSVLPVLRRAVELLDGSRSTAAVRDCLRVELERDLDVEAFAKRLGAAGLLRNAPEQVRRPGTLPAFTVATIPLTGTRGRLGFGLLLIGCAGLLLMGATQLDLLAAMRRHPGLLLPIALLASMLLHEGGHAVAAVCSGLKPRSLTVALYLGFIPMLYLRIPGLYTLAPWRRILIWSAGCAVNLGIAAGCYAWESILQHASDLGPFVLAVAAWNLALIKLNLLPFLPTDGYFIAATLLHEHNLRAQAHQVLAGWLRGRGAAVRVWVALYALATLWITVRLFVFAGTWMVMNVPAPRPAQIILFAFPILAWYGIGWLRKRIGYRVAD